MEGWRRYIGLNWIFFDLGSTLTDEGIFERYMFYQIKKSLNDSGAGVDKDTFDRTLMTIMYQRKYGSFGYKGLIIELTLRFIEDEGQLKKIMDSYDNYMSTKYLRMQVLYPESLEVLKVLKTKYSLGLIANQPRGARRSVEILGIGNYMRTIVLSEEVGISKPDVRIFLQALEMARCEPERAMMVGDRLDNDIAPAKSIGMRTTRVKRGLAAFQEPLTELEKPDYVIYDLRGLLTLQED